MLKLYINGREAALKKGTSLEYSAENRSLTESEGFSTSISLPLMDSPDNLAIFGPIMRPDVALEDVYFDALLQSESLSVAGAVAIVGIETAEVKVQFLAGKSAQNFNKSFDDYYIDELNLGLPFELEKDKVAPAEAMGLGTSSTPNVGKYVAIPWVNESYPQDLPENAYNGTSASGNLAWRYPLNSEQRENKLSWMPYMLFLTQKMCEEIGYTYDFAYWEVSEWRWLLCCNVLPAAWETPEFAKALPHWSLSQYFQELERLTGMDFDFDHTAKHVSCSPSMTAIDMAGVVKLDDVTDDFSCEVNDDDSSGPDGDTVKPYKYADLPEEAWPLMSCDWFVNQHKNWVIGHIASTAVFSEIVQILGKRLDRVYQNDSLEWQWPSDKTPGSPQIILLYKGRYFLLEPADYEADRTEETWKFYPSGQQVRDIKETRVYKGSNPLPIARFAPWLKPDVDADDCSTLNMVPVATADTGIDGYVPFIACGDMAAPLTIEQVTVTYKSNHDFTETVSGYDLKGRIAEGDDKDSGKSNSDIIRVGFFDPMSFYLFETNGLWACPLTDKVLVDPKHHSIHESNFGTSLALTGLSRQYGRDMTLDSVDFRKKYRFSWLASEIPNPRAIFHIRGKRYLCEKISATFTESGMSQLLKGEFYPIMGNNS